jgi:hypothetical protein
MMMRLDPKQVARSRSKEYLENEIEKAQGVMKEETSVHSGWIRTSFEAGHIDAALPLLNYIDVLENSVRMKEEQLQAEREARLHAERRAAAAAQLPVFVKFPSRKGPDIRVRLDQISAVTNNKIYLVTDDVPFGDMEDPRAVLDEITLEVEKLVHQMTAPAPVLKPREPSKED